MLQIELESPFDTRGAQKADKKFRKAAKDLRSVFRALVKNTLPDETVLAIRTQGVSMGEKWPDLDPDTIAARSSGRRRSTRPLIHFGSLLGRAKKGKREYKKKLTTKLLVFGPKNFRDVMVMSGTDGGHVPSRNPIGWNNRIGQKAGELMQDKLAHDITEYMGGITTRGKGSARSRFRKSRRRTGN